MENEKKQPVEKFRSGQLDGAIWANEGTKGTYYRVTFARSFRNADGKRQSTTSFSLEDLGALILLAFQASLTLRSLSRGTADAGPAEDGGE